jgi:hypothetical protein
MNRDSNSQGIESNRALLDVQAVQRQRYVGRRHGRDATQPAGSSL